MVVTVTPAKEGGAPQPVAYMGSIGAPGAGVPMKFLSWSIVNSAHFKYFSIESVAHMHPAPSHFPRKDVYRCQWVRTFPAIAPFHESVFNLSK